MKLPPQVLTLFLRSSGAPPSLIELIDLLQQEGFSAFQFQPMSKDDPNWKTIGSDPERSQQGIWVRAVGPKSRITAAIFFEGTDEKMLQAIDSASGGVLLNATAGA